MNYEQFFRHILTFVSQPRILHIGGHIGQEAEIYERMEASFTFVEPVPEFAAAIRDKGHQVIEKAVGTPGVRDFNVNGQISGFLKNKKGSKYRTIQVETVPLSEIQPGFEVLVADTEGTVLDVLKTGNLDFKVIVAELRDEPAFHGEPTRAEVEAYLAEHGYTLYANFERDYLFVKQ